jgi:2,3-bisphosphoglycerate-dependent phosphoglycerate mutase
MRHLAAAVLMVVVSAASAAAQPVIFLVRHAERADAGMAAAKAAGVPLTAIDSNDVAALLKTVRSATGNVLVVGHSNTLPEILKGLGVTEPVTIGEDEFDSLFVVTRGSPPPFVRLRYR